ncbi:hypothetical protein D3C86_1904840 [compost metagenome]
MLHRARQVENQASVIRCSPQTHAFDLCNGPSINSHCRKQQSYDSNQCANAHTFPHKLFEFQRQRGTPRFATRALRGQVQRTASRMGANGNGQVRLWQKARTSLGPFDQAQGIAFEVITNAQIFQFFRVNKAI